jgi:hypothetical protein
MKSHRVQACHIEQIKKCPIYISMVKLYIHICTEQKFLL